MPKKHKSEPLELPHKKKHRKKDIEENLLLDDNVEDGDEKSTMRPRSEKQGIRKEIKEPKSRTKHKLIPDILADHAMVFIRHACDAKDHTTIKHIHDAPLCNKESHQTKDIRNLVRLLVAKSGNREPAIIYTSPLQRCLATAKRITQYLHGSPDIVVDCRISRLFATLEQDNPQISKKTMARDIPLVETGEEFEQRLRRFTKDTYKEISKHKKKPKVVWCITHALVLKHIFETPNEHMSPLDVKVLDPKTCKYFQK